MKILRIAAAATITPSKLVAAAAFLFLLLPGCTSPSDSSRTSLPKVSEFRGSPWNTTVALGPSVLHIHVAVPDGSVCYANSTVNMKLAGSTGPDAFHWLSMGPEAGAWGWWSAADKAEAHALGADSRSVALLPIHGGFSDYFESKASLGKQVAKGGIDLYAVGNVTPLPTNPQKKGWEAWDKSVTLDYQCDHAPANPVVDLGHEVLLLDNANHPGGIGVAFGEESLGLQQKFATHISAKNVTVAAFTVNDAYTNIGVQTPAQSVQWTVVPKEQGRPFHNYLLRDGPGDYAITVDRVQAQSFPYLVAIMAANPLSGGLLGLESRSPAS